MGKEEFIAEDLEGYKEKINEYIKKNEVHGDIEREKLKGEFLELMDPERFMREYEETIRCAFKDSRSAFEIVN
jgi:hypothetical protein